MTSATIMPHRVRISCPDPAARAKEVFTAFVKDTAAHHAALESMALADFPVGKAPRYFLPSAITIEIFMMTSR
jgi:hypothetical protein